MDRQVKSQIKNKKNNKKDMGGKSSYSSGPLKPERQEKSITDWFYMTQGDINAKMISDLLKSKGFTEIELWEEMNILQIELSGNRTVDFEPLAYAFKDSSDAAFVKNRSIKTIFTVTVEEGAFDSFKPYLKILLEEGGGFLCADSEDFKPVYGLEEL